jgi:hypothetical protein
MNLSDTRSVIEALEGNVDMDEEYLEPAHDIIYIPWSLQIGAVAEKLESAGCHWSEEYECWAHF